MKETRNKNYKYPNKLLKSGQLIYAEYHRWLVQKRGIEDLSNAELVLIYFISSETFMYGREWIYLSYNELPLSRNTLAKTIKSLQEKELLKAENSRIENKKLGFNCIGKNKYTLLVPKELRKCFKFYAKEKDERITSNQELSEIFDEIPDI